MWFQILRSQTKQFIISLYCIFGLSFQFGANLQGILSFLFIPGGFLMNNFPRFHGR